MIRQVCSKMLRRHVKKWTALCLTGLLCFSDAVPVLADGLEFLSETAEGTEYSSESGNAEREKTEDETPTDQEKQDTDQGDLETDQETDADDPDSGGKDENDEEKDESFEETEEQKDDDGTEDQEGFTVLPDGRFQYTVKVDDLLLEVVTSKKETFGRDDLEAEDFRLDAQKIEKKKDVRELKEAIESELSDFQILSELTAYDIRFLTEDSEEVEPVFSVQVTAVMKKEHPGTLEVYHFDDDRQMEQIEVVTNSIDDSGEGSRNEGSRNEGKGDADNRKEENGILASGIDIEKDGLVAVSYETDSFSVYAFATITSGGYLNLQDPFQEGYSIKIGSTTYRINSLSALVTADLQLVRCRAASTTNDITGDFGNGQISGYEEVYDCIWQLLWSQSTDPVTDTDVTISQDTIWLVSERADFMNTVDIQAGARLLIIGYGSKERSNGITVFSGAPTLHFHETDKNAFYLRGAGTTESALSIQGRSTEERAVLTHDGVDNSPLIRVTGGVVYLPNVAILKMSFNTANSGFIWFSNNTSGNDNRRRFFMTDSLVDSLYNSGKGAAFMYLQAYSGTDISEDQTNNRQTALRIRNTTFTNCGNGSSSMTQQKSGGSIIKSSSGDKSELIIRNSVFIGNHTESALQDGTERGGGAIFWKSVEGTLTLQNCTFSGNTCKNGWGGAILSTAPIHVSNCHFDNNICYSPNETYAYGGGAIAFQANQASGEPIDPFMKQYLSFAVNNGCSFTGNKTISNDTGDLYGWGGAILLRVDSAKAQGQSITDLEAILSLDGAVFTANGAARGGAVAMHLSYDNAVEHYLTGIRISGGEMSGNMATTFGGAISVTHQSKYTDYPDFTGVTVTGGRIYNNTVQDGSGGAIYINVPHETAHAYHDFEITNGEIGTAGANTARIGGAVYVRAGTLFMSGGKIENNVSKTTGGGLTVTNGGYLTISGGMIRNNSAGTNGGAAAVPSGNVLMTAGTVSGNQAVRYGGAFYVTGGNVLFEGGEDPAGILISDNTAQAGGALYFVSSKDTDQVTISGGTSIINNKAVRPEEGAVDNAGDGGGLYMTAPDGTSGVLIVGRDEDHPVSQHACPVIVDNEASHDGGGACISGSIRSNFYCCRFLNNMAGADKAGGNMAVKGGTTVLGQRKDQNGDYTIVTPDIPCMVYALDGTYIDERQKDYQTGSGHLGTWHLIYQDQDGNELHDAYVSNNACVELPMTLFEHPEGYYVAWKLVKGNVNEAKNGIRTASYEEGELIPEHYQIRIEEDTTVRIAWWKADVMGEGTIIDEETTQDGNVTFPEELEALGFGHFEKETITISPEFPEGTVLIMKDPDSENLEDRYWYYIVPEIPDPTIRIDDFLNMDTDLPYGTDRDPSLEDTDMPLWKFEFEIDFSKTIEPIPVGDYELKIGTDFIETKNPFDEDDEDYRKKTSTENIVMIEVSEMTGAMLSIDQDMTNEPVIHAVFSDAPTYGKIKSLLLIPNAELPEDAWLETEYGRIERHQDGTFVIPLSEDTIQFDSMVTIGSDLRDTIGTVPFTVSAVISRTDDPENIRNGRIAASKEMTIRDDRKEQPSIKVHTEYMKDDIQKRLFSEGESIGIHYETDRAETLSYRIFRSEEGFPEEMKFMDSTDHENGYRCISDGKIAVGSSDPSGLHAVNGLSEGNYCILFTVGNGMTETSEPLYFIVTP